MTWLDEHRDANLLVLDPVKITNTQWDDFALQAGEREGDVLYLVNSLRRVHGVTETVPGVAVPVWAATHKAAVSALKLRNRDLFNTVNGELIALICQQLVRWEPSPGASEFHKLVGGAA